MAKKETEISLNAPATRTKLYTARERRIREGITGYMFMLPTVIGFSIFIIYPMITSAYYAFTEYMGFGTATWVGLENFQWMFLRDPRFFPSIIATFCDYTYFLCQKIIYIEKWG